MAVEGVDFPLVNKVHLQILTQTAVRTFRKCPRLYEQQYVQLYRPVQVAEPLQYGDFWHQIREAWWKAGETKGPDGLVINYQKGPTGQARLDAAVSKLAELKQAPDVELDEFMLSKLIVMLRGYHERWAEYIDNVEIIGVELPFEIPLVNPRSDRESRTYKVQGKIDAVIRDSSGMWVVEEKTASEALKPESAYWRKLEIDPQISMYYDACKKLFGEDPVGIRYFVNVKPQLRPLKKSENIKYKKDGSGPYANQRLEDETASEYAVRMAEAVADSPEKFYQMVEVARLERDIRESKIDVWDTAQSIRQSELSGTWLRNPDSCVHPFGSSCAFLPVCTHRASLEDPMLYRKADVAHEELVEQQA